jgi:hypothetical protein
MITMPVFSVFFFVTLVSDGRPCIGHVKWGCETIR